MFDTLRLTCGGIGPMKGALNWKSLANRPHLCTPAAWWRRGGGTATQCCCTLLASVSTGLLRPSSSRRRLRQLQQQQDQGGLALQGLQQWSIRGLGASGGGGDRFQMSP